MLVAFILATALPSQSAAEERLAALDRAARMQEAKLAAEQAPLAALLASAQRLALRPAALVLARPQAIEEMVRTRALIAALAPEIRRRTASLRRNLLVTAALRAEAEQALAALLDAKYSATPLQNAALTARLAALPGPSLPPAPAARREAAYRLPAPGTVVVGMGERSAIGVRAPGLTIATAPGAGVAAPARAHVAYAGPFRGYGDIVILDHGHGWTTLLAGLELVTAGGGELVEGGAPLGHMAKSAPRLTIELRHNGRPVDVTAMVLQ
ncbi:murein hydrolase activator EnvC family protein [Sphingomonas crusticola]|uniref:murein hydrolase activator EnvC family protein n=1 Tax=Sphingomonas crusticola TaxID=1697973 RepID=UPI0013C2E04A|nr:peptidoglycan DD-metalloendopeptidase family protein [Sphingomonas crusticola]